MTESGSVVSLNSDCLSSAMEDDGRDLGFKPQKRIVYNKLLPYSSLIKDEICDQLIAIKSNLSKAVILRDIRPGCIHWVARLARFVKLYGLCFSKEDHILLVKLMYQLVIIPQQEFWITDKFAQMLTMLLRHRELLSPTDLELPWRPLYELYDYLFYSSYNSIGMLMLPSNAEGILKAAIRACREYFPPSATAEMMEQWRPLMCPFDMSMQRAMTYLDMFLPVAVAPEGCGHSWKLWLDELIGVWVACHNFSHFWENRIMSLVSRLAWQNIGHLDLETHLPLMFTKLLMSFNLPVSYKNKKHGCLKLNGLDLQSSSRLIVSCLGGGSKTQELLSRLLKSLESYYHPSNSGVWTRSLRDFVNKLSLFFIKRLNMERHRKPTWETPVTTHKLLTEEEITAFVQCLHPPAQLMVFAKMGSHEAGVVLHRLSLLRPEIVIPPLLEQLYLSLETITEPHRLTASMECLTCVSRALVQGGNEFPEGPTHVLPILIQTLPGIDSNDIRKSMVTFQFIYTVVTLVPIVNCSSAIDEINDLTEVEQQLCLQSGNFDDFVLQFMDRCFALIENSTLEKVTQSERESSKMNREENMLELGLSSTFSAILTQCHPDIYMSALQKLQTFIKGRMMEIHVAGKLAATMCRAAVKVYPEVALKEFVPSVCRLIMTMTDNKEILTEDHLDDELLFNLLLLSELVRCSGRHLLQYLPTISGVLQRTLHLKCREGYHLAGSIIRFLLKYLALVMPQEYRSLARQWDAPFAEFLPIKHWGAPGNIHDLGLTWLEPGMEEQEAMECLLQDFLVPELKILQQVAAGELEVPRESLHQSLCITYDILIGAGGVLPHWQEESVPLVEMSVEKDGQKFFVRSSPLAVDLVPDTGFPVNVRKAVSSVVLSLMDRMLLQSSDDTKAFGYIINILHGVMFYHGVSREDFDARWQSFQFIKDALANKLTRHKQHSRSLLIERTLLQHESRVLEGAVAYMTPSHQQILDSLLRMATSHYSEVRIKSQASLQHVFQYFPYSYKLVVADLVENLKLNPTEHHEKFKGTLHVLLAQKTKSLLVRRDWETLRQLWPALLSAEHSEKPSITRLMKDLGDAIYGFLEPFFINYQIPEGPVLAAQAMLSSSSLTTIVAPSPAEVAEGEQRLQERCRNNLQNYTALMQSLVTLLNSGSLHWNGYNMTLNMLGMLLRIDQPFPADAVRIFVNSLIHDNINIRETAIFGMVWILKNQKRTHKKVEVDPFMVAGSCVQGSDVIPCDSRKDNSWLQYDTSKCLETEEDYEKMVFIEKTYFGYYAWPRRLMVYAPPSEQPSLTRDREDLSDAEKEIWDFFQNPNKVEKLFEFLTQEESKERDKFSTKRYWMFKGLFRNFGDVFSHRFYPRLQELAGDDLSSKQKCSAEILTGLIRGSKHWPWMQRKSLWTHAESILRVGMAKVTLETMEHWGTCVATLSADRDPNKLRPLVELLLDAPLREGEAAFNISCRLYLCLGVLNQQEWRVAEPWHRVLEYLKPHLAHSYESIRNRFGSILSSMFSFDIELPPGGQPTLYPRVSDFVDFVLPQLAVLMQETLPGSSNVSLSHLDDIAVDGYVNPGNNYISFFRSDESSKVSCVIDTTGTITATLAGAPAEELSEGRQVVMLGGHDVNSPEGSPPLSLCPSEGSLYKEGGNGGLGGGEDEGKGEERKMAVLLMKTLCRWLMQQMTRYPSGVSPPLYKFLPYLCQLESVDNDPELQSCCQATLSIIAQSIVLPERLNQFMEVVSTIAHSPCWRVRAAILSLLQVSVFTNMFVFLNDSPLASQVSQLVLQLLKDSRLEVQQMASQVLSGLIHCRFIDNDSQLLQNFTSSMSMVSKKCKGLPLTPQQVTELHANTLGLCAYVSAFPYEVPEPMPEVLVTLSEHLNDPHPIPATIKKTLSNFRRTHHDNWRDHKLKFTDDQLGVLTDLLLSPSYYA